MPILFHKILRILRRQKLRGRSAKDIFSDVYHKNGWGSSESLSGPGSELRNTKPLITELPKILNTYNIKHFLDLPCGDFHWMQHCDLTGIHYTGADIVDDLIVHNNKQYSNPDRSFRTLNLLSDELPQADLIMVRDCLVHFSFSDIEKALANIRRSGTRYLLTTMFPEHLENKAILTGEWRMLNMTKPPINFPEPVVWIEEVVEGYDGKKWLALWDLNAL
jgi:hypothetical protein